jgi:glutaredoxin-related protein
VDGKLVGGCDIVREMHARGELKPLIDRALGKN